jgi:hypothetical protein
MAPGLDAGGTGEGDGIAKGQSRPQISLGKTKIEQLKGCFVAATASQATRWRSGR